MGTPLGSWVSPVSRGLRANIDLRAYTLQTLVRDISALDVRILGDGLDVTPNEAAFALARLIGGEIECRMVCEYGKSGRREFVTSSRDVVVLLSAVAHNSAFVLNLQELARHVVTVFDMDEDVHGAMLPLRYTFNPDAIVQWAVQSEERGVNSPTDHVRVLAEAWSSAMRSATIRFLTVYL